MGRKKVGAAKRVPVGLTLPPDLIKRLDALRGGVSRSNFIETCILEHEGMQVA